jgi:hypothetical protein
MHPTVTVTVCVPVIEGFWLAAAVTVADPVLTDVTRPVEEIVAIVVGVMLQETDGLLVVLPSLLVPNTVICTVLSVVPVSIVGDAGPIDIEDMTGFWKKPLQLIPKANVARAAKAPIRWSLRFIDDIVFGLPGLALRTCCFKLFALELLSNALPAPHNPTDLWHYRRRLLDIFFVARYSIF